jgi:hypothetical protein
MYYQLKTELFYCVKNMIIIHNFLIFISQSSVVTGIKE